MGLYKWIMPESGVLKLDYSSAKRAPPSARTLSMWISASCSRDWRVVQKNSRLEGAIDSVEQLRRTSDSQIMLRALRTVSHMLYLKTWQLRRLLNNQPSDSARSDCFVIMFNMVVDAQNEKLYRVRIEDPATIQSLR